MAISKHHLYRYRVEIHSSGDTSSPNDIPTFKWSRENGSVVTRWLGFEGKTVTLANARGFSAGSWVEFATEADSLLAMARRLTRITQIDGNVPAVESAPAWDERMVNPAVRLWAQKTNDELTLAEGAIEIHPALDEQGWIEIEDGIAAQSLLMLEATGSSPFGSLTKDCRWQFAGLPCLETDG